MTNARAGFIVENVRSLARTIPRDLLRDVAALGAACFVVGLSFGAIAVASGTTVAQASAMSLFVFAGGAQFLAVGVTAAGGTAVAAVLARDGVAEREYDGYFGRTTIAATMADFYGWDLVVHGSDIARATGQEWSISDEEAAALHRTADGWGDALYSEGVCAEAVPVPEDASASDRLLARLGTK